MKAKILLCSMLILGSLSYAAEPTPTDSVAQEVMSEVKNIKKIGFLFRISLNTIYFIDKFKEKKYTLFRKILSIFTQKV